jgi:membrane protease YdiL (CAAX protease family)
MAYVDLFALTITDYALHAAGAIIGLMGLRKLWLRWRWTQPLADVQPSGSGPELQHLVVVVFAYILTSLALISVLRSLEPPGFQPVPPPRGSPGWHLRLAVDHAAKLVASVLIVYLLRSRPGFADPPAAACAPTRLSLLAVSATLVLIAVTTVQYQMVLAIWSAFDPTAKPPEHQVLEALQNDPLPPWGTLHLTLQAVVVAPLVEELFFRGLLLQSLWHLTGLAWPAVLLSALLFGLVHLSVPQSVLPLVTMGCALGYLRLRHRSLGLCIAVHVLFNLRTMSMALLNPQTLLR